MFFPGTPNTNILYLYSEGSRLDGINNLSGNGQLIEGSGTFDDLRLYEQWYASQCAGFVLMVRSVDGADPSYIS